MVLQWHTVSVYLALMSTYRALLEVFLGRPENTEKDLAEAIGKAQPTVNRYRQGERFPDADTARDIDKATGGDVPFSAWQREFLERSGIAA